MTQHASGVWFNKRALLSVELDAPFEVETINGDWAVRFLGDGQVTFNEERSGRPRRLPVQADVRLRSGGEDLLLAYGAISATTPAGQNSKADEGKPEQGKGKR